MAVLARICELFKIFEWRQPLWTSSDIETMLRLSDEQRVIAEQAPPSGRYSIPRLIVCAVTGGIPLNTMNEYLRVLRKFGIRGPSRKELYNGNQWHSIASASVIG